MFVRFFGLAAAVPGLPCMVSLRTMRAYVSLPAYCVLSTADGTATVVRNAVVAMSRTVEWHLA